jgi:hypothetical protein
MMPNGRPDDRILPGCHFAVRNALSLQAQPPHFCDFITGIDHLELGPWNDRITRRRSGENQADDKTWEILQTHH